MRTLVRLSGIALAAALAAPLWAGECPSEAQVCLDYMAKMRDRGYAGVDLTSDAAGSFTVTKVYAGTPAAADIRIGDVLVSIAGIRLGGNEEERQRLNAAMKPGNTVDFAISREGQERTYKLTLIRMPDDVFDRFVGEHMLQHTGADAAVAK